MKYLQRKKHSFHRNLRQTNHFDRLPDDLILVIFNKILEPKSLIRCLLVTKRFASLIPQTKNLSLFMDFSVLRDLSPPINPSSDYIQTPCDLIADLKSKFPDVESLKMVFHYPVRARTISIKYNVVFGSHFKCCSILFATFSPDIKNNFAAAAAATYTAAKEYSLEHGEFETLIPLLIEVRLSDASHRHLYLQTIVSDLKMLTNVTVEDDWRMGKLCLSEKEIVELKGYVNSRKAGSPPMPEVEESFEGPLRVEMWYVPVLNLPSSGIKMMEATLLVVKPRGGGDRTEPIVIERDVEMMLRGFNDDGEEEEKKVFGEAVVWIMNDKKKKKFAFEIPTLVDRSTRGQD